MRTRQRRFSVRSVSFGGIIAVAALAITATAAAPDKEASPSTLRLDVKVTLDGTGRSVQQVLDDLNPQLRGVRLRAAPTLLGEFAAVRTADRPASEILEALAWAVHGEWRPVPGGLRLQYVEAPPAEKGASLPLDLTREPALQSSIMWPPAPVERAGRALPRARVEGDYHHRSLGASLVAAALERSLSVVVVSPALRGSPNHSGKLGERARATGAALFEEMAALEGGRWQRVGNTFVLGLPAVAVKLRQQPREALFRSLREPSEQFYISLTRQQQELLRPGRVLSGKDLTEVQKGLMARYAELHHACAPIYPRRLVEDRSGYYLKGTQSSVELGLGMGERPLSEIERPDLDKLQRSRLEP